MKALGICMVLVCCFGFTSAWAAEEEASVNVLDKRFTFYGGAQFYQANGEFGYIKEGQPDITVDWDGSLWFVNAFLEYWPFKNAGIGAGCRYIDADVDYEPGHKKETYDFSLPGPVVYVAVGF